MKDLVDQMYDHAIATNPQIVAALPEVDELTFRAVGKEILLRVVPEKYRSFGLSNLKPDTRSRLSLEEQASLYKEMLDHPLDGWAFFAPAGYSKTTCSYALYRRAVAANLAQWWPQQNHHQAYEFRVVSPGSHEWYNPVPKIPRIYVWRKSIPDLLQQHFNIFNYTEREGSAPPPQPDITVEKIQEAVRRGFTPRVFLEEIDKIKPSEFAINQLFRLFDALDRHKGQIVIDTNLSAAQFVDTFGEPIARRVKENCRVKEYGF